MYPSPCPRISYSDHVGVLFGIVQELFETLPGCVGSHQEHDWIAYHIDDRFKIFVSVGCGYLMGKDRERRNRRNKCVTIWFCLHAFCVPHRSCTAWSVDDDNRSPEILPCPCSQSPKDQ